MSTWSSFQQAVFYNIFILNNFMKKAPHTTELTEKKNDSWFLNNKCKRKPF